MKPGDKIKVNWNGKVVTGIVVKIVDDVITWREV